MILENKDMSNIIHTSSDFVYDRNEPWGHVINVGPQFDLEKAEQKTLKVDDIEFGMKEWQIDNIRYFNVKKCMAGYSTTPDIMPLVWVEEDHRGVFTLVDGHHRVCALMELGIENIDAMVLYKPSIWEQRADALKNKLSLKGGSKYHK